MLSGIEKGFSNFIATTAKISRPFIDATNVYHAVEGKSGTLICKVTVNDGDQVFIDWKYPNSFVAEVRVASSSFR